MAAHTGQGKYFTLFLAALTLACAGIAYSSSGLGKLLAVVGIVGVVASLLGTMSIKKLEGKTAQKAGAGIMKVAGALASCAGWLVTLVSLHFTQSTGGRMTAALLGIAISLFGILYILPSAFNKNAIWKA
jgi:hypothetical protein